MADTQQAASASPMPPGVTDPNYKPQAGRLGNLTVPQQHALDTLKKQLKEEGQFFEERMDDATLLRLAGSRLRSPPALTHSHLPGFCGLVGLILQKPRRCS